MDHSQQNDTKSFAMRITVGYEPSATHAWLEFPSPPRDPPGETKSAASPSGSADVDDPDYASAWNFTAFVQQRSKSVQEVKQATLPIDTTILLEDQLWYHDKIPGTQAESILKHYALYSFLVRKSSTTIGSYVMSVKISDYEHPYCTHVRIVHDKEKGYTFGDSVNSPFFNSVPACIDYCTRNNFSLCNDSIQLQTSARPLANPVPRSL